MAGSIILQEDGSDAGIKAYLIRLQIEADEFNPTKRQDILNIFVKTVTEQRDYS